MYPVFGIHFVFLPAMPSGSATCIIYHQFLFILICLFSAFSLCLNCRSLQIKQDSAICPVSRQFMHRLLLSSQIPALVQLMAMIFLWCFSNEKTYSGNFLNSLRFSIKLFGSLVYLFTKCSKASTCL